MVFKKLHKNKFINFILIILVLGIISYFFINYYFKKQEGLTNKNDNSSDQENPVSNINN